MVGIRAVAFVADGITSVDRTGDYAGKGSQSGSLGNQHKCLANVPQNLVSNLIFDGKLVRRLLVSRVKLILQVYTGEFTLAKLWFWVCVPSEYSSQKLVTIDYLQ